ncbi:phage gp6-like head-tail connector protein [Bacillus sp. TH22]|uniref:Phage gp6-like head-tail connector protein n=1 Tax=Bacillus mobilis TaxID=2026190 RepID=A0A1Y5ZRG3_9BACI|nr:MULTISPECIES: head-tail connector protein [Bacillus]HDR6315186.1 phage gp6-like head-tail connector protein [Bacillus thuringiensis]MBK5447490.1 phage gp6-like head-tail connector protein [Bacillus sp. TH22]MBK5453652.1 phage gp6-like head-tail connector protein [Bacillus sp. TH23]MCU5599088.1 head-tail connector protein [Bacillus wiedmannii]MED3078404.1 head-tail connector protein [Bacillus wiedmannii]
MVLKLEEAKEYLRVDGDEEDSLISSFITAAEIYIKNATSKNVDLKSELAKLAARILISHWYENREAVGKAEQLAFSLQSILVQLQYCVGDST